MLLFESMMDTVLFARDKWLKDHRHGNDCSLLLLVWLIIIVLISFSLSE